MVKLRFLRVINRVSDYEMREFAEQTGSTGSVARRTLEAAHTRLQVSLGDGWVDVPTENVYRCEKCRKELGEKEHEGEMLCVRCFESETWEPPCAR